MWENDPVPATGMLYLGCLYIEKIGEHWPARIRTLGEWSLTIGNMQWASNDLPDLERKLYEFAVGEGYCE